MIVTVGVPNDDTEEEIIAFAKSYFFEESNKYLRFRVVQRVPSSKVENFVEASVEFFCEA